MKPLTPGCTALVTKGTMSGSEVTCIKHVGMPEKKDIEFNQEYDCWEVDPPMPWTSITYTGKLFMLDIWPTMYLMRIDGHERDQSDEINDVLEFNKTHCESQTS